jgi:hypothetical protein
VKLKTVTLTGADDRIDPGVLTDLAEEFPFVEFGILFSRDRAGTERYPTRPWIKRLLDWAEFYRRERNRPFPIAAHLCGPYVAAFIDQAKYPGWRPDWSGGLRTYEFGRVQLNLDRNQVNRLDTDTLDEYGGNGVIILRTEEGFDDLAGRVISYNTKHERFALLHDRSGGTGFLPAGWPEADPRIRCGYAGGLNLDNLDTELAKIAVVAGDARIWIDLETGVRDAKNHFDVGRARLILEKARPWITTPAAAR